MSASLVGSEMCIRDRSTMGKMQNRSRRSNLELHRPRKDLNIGPRSSPGAVSYTHLTLPTICSV
eukprot:3018843-Alexandrium_andersonii.AAC.1